MGKHSQQASTRPLLVTDDEKLLDTLLELAQRAGVDVDVAPDVGTAASLWADASRVVVDGGLVGDLALLTIPRRGGVVVVGRDLDDADVWRRSLTIGAGHVVFLPDAAEWVVSMLSAASVGAPAARVIGVVGGCGGVGASTTAAALAIHARQAGRAVALVDADPLSGGLDLLLGAEGEVGLRWPELAETRGRIDPEALLGALPVSDGVPLLTWDDDVRDVPGAAFTSVVGALASRCDVVVVDLGRATSDATDALVGFMSVVLLIVPARVRGVAAARRLLPRLASAGEGLQLAVRLPSPAGLDPVDVQSALGLPLLGEVPHDARRAELEENGIPPRVVGDLQRLATAVLGLDLPTGRAA